MSASLVGSGDVYKRQVLESFGFVRGQASACCFYNAKLDVRCVVHGDDFTCLLYTSDAADDM
eukprot:13732055-Alexandrium_andersonii.AAC.1